jgi:hypothetical protein
MAIPNFSGDEDNYKISLEEWLRMINKNFYTPFGVGIFFYGEGGK